MRRRRDRCLVALCLGITLLALTKPASAIIVTRICSDEILIESGTSNTGMYMGYDFLNDGGTAMADVWVTLDNFAGGVITLATNETGEYSLGTLLPGESKQAYFYLHANGTTALPQSHDVNVRLGSPTDPPVGTDSFSYTVVDAQGEIPCNEVHTVTVLGSPVIGTVVEVHVVGQSGAVGSPSDYIATPATDELFPANAFRLEGVNTVLSTVVDGCITEVANVNGSMIIAIPPDAAGYCYTVTYTFRIVGATGEETAVSPRQYINSGVQIKYQCADVSAAIPPIGNNWWKGTQYWPLGDAQLWLAPEGLTMSNVGSSGQDGAVFAWGANAGGQLGWKGSSMPLPIGSAMVFEAQSVSGIVPCVRVSHDSPGVTTITPGSSPLSNIIYEVWKDGAYVGEYVGLPTDVTAQEPPVVLEFDNETFPEIIAGPTLANLEYRMEWENDQLFEVPSVPGVSATGDELRIIADDLSPESTSGLKVLFETTTPPISVEFTDFHQIQFGRLHQVDGGLMLFGLTAPAVSRSGPAVTGQESADWHEAATPSHADAPILIPPGATATIRWEMEANEVGLCVLWDPDNTGDGVADLVSTAVFTEGNGGVADEVVLFTVDEASSGPAWIVTPDFSPVGSFAFKVRAVDVAGNLVHEVASYSGPITVQTSDYPTKTELLDYDNLGFELGYPTDVGIDIPGEGTYVARRLQMFPVAPNSHNPFIAVERAITPMAGGVFVAIVERNAMLLPGPGGVENKHVATGVAYVREYGDHAMISNIGSSGQDGVDIVPVRVVGGQDIQFYPMGPASSQYGAAQATHRMTGEFSTSDVMSLNLSSDGTAVHVNVDPEQSSTPYFKVTLKNQGIIAAEFDHSDFATALANLPEWPTGLGYRALEYENQPWLMYVDLGQEMLVNFPDPLPGASGASSAQVLADVIIVTAQQTVHPPDPVKRSFALKIKDILYFPYKKSDKPKPSAVDPKPPDASSVLHVGYPNPFNPTATLAFELAQPGRATLTVYDVSGAVVAVLHDGVLPAGPHEMRWDGRDRRGARVASGVYFVELHAPDGRSFTKISLLK